MLKEEIIKKFTQILASIPTEQQEALARELAKMIPADENADVDWSVGWGYYIEKEEVSVGISLKIVPAKLLEQEVPLIELLANVINMGKMTQLLDLEKALVIILEDITAHKKMTFTPALGLTEVIFAIRLRFWGIPSEKARKDDEDTKEIVAPQETICL